MTPKDIRYWKKVIESSFDEEQEQLDEIAPIIAAGARAAVTAAGAAVGRAAGQALSDKALGPEVDESEEEDLPTGEYMVCQDCHGEGCINCEHGLVDITGKFKKPDFSNFEFVDENADDAFYDPHVSSGPDRYNAVLHIHRDDFPLKHIKDTLRKIGMPTAAVVRSHLPNYIAVKMPREMLAAAKERLWPHKDLEETYSSPPPFGDMIAAGFPDVAPGDRIRTRKGNGAGIISAIRVHPKKGTEEVFFVDDNGKKWKTALSNVLKVTPVAEEDVEEGRYDGEFEEDEPMFKDGDKVRLKPEYADNPGEVFWVSQCDPDRGRCWIGDEQGRGWYARFGQLELAKKKKKQVFDSLEETELNEVYGLRPEMEYKGFRFYADEDREEDNIKIWHIIETPGGESTYLDHSPYEHMKEDTFQNYVEFYIKNGRFPSRQDINSRGPLHYADLAKLVGR